MPSKSESGNPRDEPEALQSIEVPVSMVQHDSGVEKSHLDELHFKQDGVQADAALTGETSSKQYMSHICEDNNNMIR